MDPGPRSQPNKIWTNPPDVGGGYSNTEGTGTQITGDGNDGYFIDDNTFGVNVASNPTTYNGTMWPVYYTRADTATVYRKTISETADNFAGLCAKCHGNSSGTTLITNMVSAWSGHGAVKGATAQNDLYSQDQNLHNHGMDRIVGSASVPTGLSGVRLINSVSLMGAAGFGWAVQPIPQKTAGTRIKYHDFPCSKCHTPHASRLPRLMRTNCLDVWDGASGGGRNSYPRHRYTGGWIFGNPPIGGTAGGDPTDGDTGPEAWHYPTAQNNATTRTGGRPMHCHNMAGRNTGTAGQAPPTTGGGWNAVTGW